MHAATPATSVAIALDGHWQLDGHFQLDDLWARYGQMGRASASNAAMAGVVVSSATMGASDVNS